MLFSKSSSVWKKSLKVFLLLTRDYNSAEITVFPRPRYMKFTANIRLLPRAKKIIECVYGPRIFCLASVLIAGSENVFSWNFSIPIGFKIFQIKLPLIIFSELLKILKK